MTRLFNNPTSFVDEMTDGLVAANRSWLRRVDGGVVRRSLPVSPQVAIVVGGGSGHYPAFAGLVGPGLAHGAAMGNVFASPSAERVYNVALRCQTGAGVLLTYGNYAGDVLNFDRAQERLIAQGVPCQTVVVTDDIVSAPAAERHRRRGVAGDLAVFKVAGAAAQRGNSLDEVAAVTRRANDRCRSFGVAFTGCTLPGADAPLFDVPPGMMGVGVGVHGEIGVGERPMPSADELADLFVDTLLAEVPADIPGTSGARLVVLLNGLGAVKYEELFVVYRRVAEGLTSAGLTIVDAKVGELVTSFDMAGASLTLFWLDDELEALWSAPASTPAFSQGMAVTASDVASDDDVDDAEDGAPPAFIPPSAGPESKAAARVLAAALRAVAAAVDERVDELGRLDAVAGDGDHGLGMQRGARAAAAAAEDAAERGAGVRTALDRAADAWANQAGGTSGALWGVGLHAVARELNDETCPSSADLQKGVSAAVRDIEHAGRAKPRDKTMLDALLPFAAALGSAGTGWVEAAHASDVAAQATAGLPAKMGRARLHADESIGSPDPGAVSFALVASTAVRAIAGERVGSGHD